uniref:Uncharacterized protein n=1 Tax=Arion vulgaris TaxID=1028688 RepID=A0A0B7AP49_9EUPU
MHKLLRIRNNKRVDILEDLMMQRSSIDQLGLANPQVDAPQTCGDYPENESQICLPCNADTQGWDGS